MLFFCFWGIHCELSDIPGDPAWLTIDFCHREKCLLCMLDTSGYGDAAVAGVSTSIPENGRQDKSRD